MYVHIKNYKIGFFKSFNKILKNNKKFHLEGVGKESSVTVLISVFHDLIPCPPLQPKAMLGMV